jgi:hypothetical protein
MVEIGSAGFGAPAGAVGLVLSVGLFALAPEARAAARPLRCDFDGDGLSDLAVGVPGDNKGRGAVNVQYSPDGLLGAGAYFLRPLNVPGPSFAGHRVGSSLACGNFDGDDYGDLAIGIPGEQASRGAIVVLYGSSTGLFDKFGSWFNQDWVQGETAEAGDRFGEALAAGDFDDDGHDDLAIGVPGEGVGSALRSPSLPGSGVTIKAAGMVHVLFGFSGGLQAATAQTFSPVTPGSCCVKGSAHYGAALAVGDFDGGGVADLAIGAPWSDVGPTTKGAGAVHVLLGQAGVGLSLTGHHLDQAVLAATTPRSEEFFGFSLAVGDFDGVRGDDLAIGAPLEKLETDFSDNGIQEAGQGYGAVHVVHFTGVGVGLVISSSDRLMEDEFSGFGDGIGNYNKFGWSLAAGNFDGEHGDDLAIGLPGQRAVAVIYGNGVELSVGKVQFFYPGDFEDGIQTPPCECPDDFGDSLAAGDYQGDGIADLFIGVPAYNFGSADKTGVGAVEIKPGVAGSGLGFSYLLLHQDLDQPNKTWAAAETSFSFKGDWLFKVVGERFGYAIGR